MQTVEHVIIGAGLAGLVVRHLLDSEESILLDPNPGSYKIGESLIPELFRHPELERLLPKVRALPSYAAKHGSLFVGPDRAVYFPLGGVETRISMHVYRAELEEFLREEWDVPVVQERVRSIDFDERVVHTDGGSYRFRGQVIDCSGPAMVVASMLGEVDQLVQVHARWAYHDIVHTDAARYDARLPDRGRVLQHYDHRHYRIVEDGSIGNWAPEHATILTQIDDGVWSWQIPLFGGDVLSFGVVSRHAPVTLEQYERVVAEHTADCYDLRRRPESPDPLDREHVRDGFARRARRASSKDFILVSDAFAFSDPIYSVGTGFAVNQAASIAARLNQGPWDDEAIAIYNERADRLVDRAFAAFELWYRGKVTTDDEAAAEVQHGCLHGDLFRDQIAEHYANVSNDADLPAGDDVGAARDPFHPILGAEPIGGDVDRLLGRDEVPGWRRGRALRCTAGVRIAWEPEAGAGITMLVSAPLEDTPCYVSRGPFRLSYLADDGEPTMDTGPLFDAVAARLMAREQEWVAFVRASGSA